jgi:hypothetical protein
MFQTAIREAWRDGINYSGHYVVANWGCGSGCTQFAVVDAITGIIYDPPFQDLDFHYGLGLAKDPKWANYEPQWLCYDDRLAYQPDSGLLVVEGCVSEHQCGRTFFKMNAQGLQQVAFDPDLLPDGTIAPR